MERAAGRRPLRRPSRMTSGRPGRSRKLTDDKRYYYAYDARVLGDGTVDLLGEQPRSTPARRRRAARSGTTPSSPATRARPGRTSSSRRCRSARPASPTAAAPTSTLGQTSVVADAPGRSRLRLRGPRRPPEARSGSTSRRRRTAAAPGAPACPLGGGRERHRAAARLVGRRRRSHLVHADLRRTIPTPGTSGTAARRTAARAGRPGEDQRRPAGAAGYVTRTASARSTATTARSR